MLGLFDTYLCLSDRTNRDSFVLRQVVSCQTMSGKLM